MPTYSVADVVGKTLFARKNVAIKRLPQTSAPTVYTVKPGTPVGVVYSWLQRDGNIWWMYYDQNNKAYYTLHTPNAYDTESLGAQGAVSLQEVQEAADKKDDPVGYYVAKFTKPIIWAVVGYLAFQAYLDYDAQQNKSRRK